MRTKVNCKSKYCAAKIGAACCLVLLGLVLAGFWIDRESSSFRSFGESFDSHSDGAGVLADVMPRSAKASVRIKNGGHRFEPSSECLELIDKYLSSADIEDGGERYLECIRLQDLAGDRLIGLDLIFFAEEAGPFSVGPEVASRLYSMAGRKAFSAGTNLGDTCDYIDRHGLNEIIAQSLGRRCGDAPERLDRIISVMHDAKTRDEFVIGVHVRMMYVDSDKAVESLVYYVDRFSSSGVMDRLVGLWSDEQMLEKLEGRLRSNGALGDSVKLVVSRRKELRDGG